MKKNEQRRNRKVLAPLATLVVAGAIVVGSGASFTSESVNPGNMYATGTLTQSNSKDNTAIFNMDNLKPGDVLEGEVTITNTGTLPAAFTLTETDGENTFVAKDKLTMVVTDITDPLAPITVFDGQFGAMTSESLDVFAAEEARTYEFAVTLDQTADNGEQGKTAGATYTWDAVQTEAETYRQP